MNISELGYLVLETAKIDDWRHYAESFLGLMVAKAEMDALSLRMDERECRLLIKKSDHERLGAVGWIVHTRQELRDIVKKLEEHGQQVIQSSEDERDERYVREMIATIDPLGVRHEFAWGPVANFRTLFQSKVNARFVTGKQGMGHVVFGVPKENFEAEEQFIENVLGMDLANFRRRSVFPERGNPVPLNWYAFKNNRHHSLAMGEISRDHAIQHLMLEVADFDDVGRALDRVDNLNVPQASTLGRHANDRSISFYTATPSGFWVEYGHVLPGVDYDEVCWDDGNGGSRWGHKYLMPF